MGRVLENQQFIGRGSLHNNKFVTNLLKEEGEKEIFLVGWCEFESLRKELLT